MKNKLLILSILIFHNINAQIGVTDSAFIKLNIEAKKLEQQYLSAEKPIYKSIPQTTGHYFSIVTTDVKQFLADFDKAKHIDDLRKKYSNLIVNYDVVITKKVKERYDGQYYSIEALDINDVWAHSFSFPLDSQIHRLKFYKQDSENKKIVQGIFLDKTFSVYDIPQEYSDWITYEEIMIVPDSLKQTESRFCGTRSGPWRDDLITARRTANVGNWGIYQGLFGYNPLSK